jgi:hypothetical protein
MTTVKQLLKLHQDTCDKARETMKLKNHDYCGGAGAGIDPFANFKGTEMLGIPAEIGILVRVLDKIKRLQTFVHKGVLKVKGESIEDAIEDSVNYLILLKGLIQDRKLSKKKVK